MAGPVLIVLTSDSGRALPAAAGVVDSIFDTGSPSNSGAVKLDLGELGATDAVLLGRGWSLPVHMCAQLSTRCWPAELLLDPVSAHASLLC